MTALEARVAAIENDMLVLCAAIQQVAITQTLFTSLATAQLKTIAEQVQRLHDDFNDGDEWKDFG